MTIPAHQLRLVVQAARHNIPLDVSLELTHHCNFRCKHCYIPDFLAPDLLTTERILMLLEELAEAGTMFLTLTGGEMFLRRDWLTIARRARELGFALRLFSNGSLIEEHAADAVAGLACAVEISLYSMDEEVFEDITQRPGSFAKTLRGIELLRERGVEVLIKTPMTIYNHRDLDAIAAYAERVGAGFHASPTILAKKDGDPSTLALRVPQDELAAHYGGPHLGCWMPAEGAEDPRGDGPLCAAANRYCNITSAGDVMACNGLPGSGGNVRERSFRDVWENSPWLNEVRGIRREDLHTCKNCSRLSYCGRCHAQALVEDGDLYGPSSYAQERAEITERLVSLNRREPRSEHPTIEA
ncbi:MAG: radical SAM protein [bacterium]|nr:radical SAM protein [bacterium]